MRTLWLAYTALLFGTVVFGSAPGHAEPVKYAYTGKAFTDISPNGSDYTTSMSVSGFFTVPSVLDCSSTCDLLSLFTLQQDLNWSFTDGLSTLTASSIPLTPGSDHFIVTTDATGMFIQTWDIFLSGNNLASGCHGLQDCSVTTQNDDVKDQGEYVGPAVGLPGVTRYDASVSNKPGTWECQAPCGTPAQVDEPRGLGLLLIAALTAWISVLGRRSVRKRGCLQAQHWLSGTR